MKVLSIEFTSEYIYLYQQNVSKQDVVVEGKYRLNMPPNAYFNRMLINNDRSISDTIRNCITEHGIKCKKTIVTIPNTDSMVEEFSVLNSKRKQMDGMVEQELRKRHKLNADYIYDYVILGEDPLKEGFVKVQVTLCVKAMIQNLYDVIKKAGLIPYKVTFTNHVMEQIADACKLIKAKESTILSCINSDEAHFLYVGHNEEPYYRYSRLKSENKVEENMFILSSINAPAQDADSDDGILRKLQGDLTRLGRFHSQRHPDREIEHIYLYGSYDKIPKLAEGLEEFLNIPTTEFRLQDMVSEVKYTYSEDEYTANAVASTMSLLEGAGASYDFFGKLEELRQGGKDSGLFLPAAVALALVIFTLGATLICKNQTADIKAETVAVEAYLNDPTVQLDYQNKTKMIDDCAKYQKYNDQVASAIALLESMPRFESAVFRDIDGMKPYGVTITGYNYANGGISLGCQATSQYVPARFAQVLQESGKYKEVGYAGFNKGVDAKGGNQYSFDITLKMW